MERGRALIESFKRFVRAIRKDEKVALFFDTDPDGVCSAVIIAKSIERMRGRKVDYAQGISHKKSEISPRLLSRLRRQRVRHIIFTDYSLDQRLPELKRMEQFANILILDHHKIYHRNLGENTVMVKPQLFSTIEASQYCSSKLAYDLFSEMVDLSDLDWVSVIGLIADSNYRTWKGFCNKTFRRHGIRGTKPFETPLGMLSNLMAYFDIFRGGKVVPLFRMVYRARSYHDLLNSELAEVKKLKSYIDKHIQGFDEIAYKSRSSYVLCIRPRLRIGSIVSTAISMRRPDKTIVVVQEMGATVHVSARRQDFKVPVNELLEKACRGIPNATAGGHIPAAGATFPSKYFARFYANLLRLIQ